MYIYIHLPFCTSICSYCDFPKLLYDKKFSLKYLNALEKEIRKRYQNEKIVSIYIGGGTPTSLDLTELEILLKITQIFNKNKNIEFTIESNVESLTIDKIILLKKYGVNRVSLGVQSFQENILKELNRQHNKEMVVEVIKNLKKYGIYNISIDYIYGVDSKIDGVIDDMNIFLDLDIPHISCYGLIIENGTIFKIKGKKNIDDEIEEKMYHTIESILEKNFYKHYEISNYAKNGFQSIHNLNYWNNGEYYGFGLGAVSFLKDVRIENTKNLSSYLKEIYIKEKNFEDLNTKISNELILGFRKIEGISMIQFKNKYHVDIVSLFDIKELINQGLLEIVDNYIRIPLKYIYMSNEILIHFI